MSQSEKSGRWMKPWIWWAIALIAPPLWGFLIVCRYARGIGRVVAIVAIGAAIAALIFTLAELQYKHAVHNWRAGIDNPRVNF
jgi:hypothetical protein